MNWIAQCHLCPISTRVPKEYQLKDQALAWASRWEDEHIREAHHDPESKRS